MQRFEGPHDPLAERVSDVELRQVLERLGEAQFGGDERATVGAVVEATGADAATVLRILGEIRAEAIEAQRIAMAAMDQRVSRLETQRRVSSFDPESRYLETDFSESARGRASLIIALVTGALFLVFFLGLARMSARPARPSFDPMISVSTDDGWVSRDENGSLRVRRQDGTTRDVSAEESIVFGTLSGAEKNGR